MTTDDRVDPADLRQDAVTLRDAVTNLSRGLSAQEEKRRRRFRRVAAGVLLALAVVVGLQLFNNHTIRERGKVMCPLLVSAYIPPDDPRRARLSPEERARYEAVETEFLATLDALDCQRP